MCKGKYYNAKNMEASLLNSNKKLHIGLKMINNSQTNVKVQTCTNVSFSFSCAFMPSYLLVSCCMVFLNVSLLLCKLTLSSISFYKKIDIETMKKL